MRNKKLYLTGCLFFLAVLMLLSGASVLAAEQVPSVVYQTHVQNVGTQKAVADGGLAGTSGKSLRVEALKINLKHADGGITYRAHVQKIGWQGWQTNGKTAGTTGRKLRVEAVQIKLTGAIAKRYDIYYCAHVQNFGDLAWAKNGKTAGTEGLGLRIEGIRIKLVKKGSAAPENRGTDTRASLTKTLLKQNIGLRYQAHVQNIGWQGWQTNGKTAGTTGRKLRVEAYRVALDDKLTANSYITYHSHIQTIGSKQNWISSKNTKAYSGTIGKHKRVEAVQMKLGGYAAKGMNIYYRVHVQNIGWTGWAKNGEWAGTSGGGLRIEALQIVLRTKNEGAPGKTANHYKVYRRAGNAAFNFPKNQKWAVYAEQLTGDKQVINIGGTQRMQTASCAKVFIMATVYSRGIKSGERALVQKMITVSDNTASNTLLSHLGGGNAKKGLTVVNNWCRKNGYTQTSMGRLFLEKKPRGDNYSSARDLSNLLKSIKQGTCVNAQASKEMLGYLRGQKYTDKIPAGVRAAGKKKTIGNKTGEIALGQGVGCIDNDAAIVYDSKNAYTIVVLSNNLNGDNQNARIRIKNIAKAIASRWP